MLLRAYTCRLETPAADMTPNITRNIPPITGVGIVVNIAPTLPSIPIITIKTPLTTITMRLPTCRIKKAFNQMYALECLTSRLTSHSHFTFVIPRAPTFSLYDVVPFPVPQAPASRQPSPSIPMPLLIACLGGGGAPDSLAQAW